MKNFSISISSAQPKSSNPNNLFLRKYSFNVKSVLFQTNQFSISTQFSFILPKDRTLLGAKILSQSV